MGMPTNMKRTVQINVLISPLQKKRLDLLRQEVNWAVKLRNYIDETCDKYNIPSGMELLEQPN